MPVGARATLLSLPLSRETTFDLRDLEELRRRMEALPPA